MTTENHPPTNIFRTFARERVLLAVIHAKHDEQVFKSMDIAFENGADGVFLINQGMDASDVVRLLRSNRVQAMREESRWIGANLLGYPPEETMGRHHSLIDGLWTDTSGIGFDGFRDTWLPSLVGEIDRVAWKGLWFGGVAFKYTHTEHASEEKIAEMIGKTAGINVVTTSGPGTGLAAPVEKISAFRKALVRRSLAIASGITAANVASYFPYANAFIVGTGIESSFGELDPAKVRTLADIIHGDV
jgi:hypothetical protein